MLPWLRKRLILAFLGLTVAAALTVWHLYHIQLVQGDQLSQRAWQINFQQVALEQFERGEITDRYGVPLAGGYYANRLVVFPALMQNQEQDLKTLASLLELKLETLAEQALPGAFTISQPLTEAQQNILRQLDLPGAYLLPVYQRYGTRPLAVHLTGHLGKIDSKQQFTQLQENSAKRYNLGDWVGRSGLELFYEKELKGTYLGRWARIPVDVRGRVIEGPGVLVNSVATDPGRLHVVTTIDHRVQNIVEDIMDQHLDDGAVVVMQAGTENILAMASRPSYNPNPKLVQAHVEAPNGEVFVDHSTALYQPGSVFKVVLAAAALEKGIVGVKSPVIRCDGSQAKPISCWSAAGHGIVDLEQAFIFSCNPAFVEIGRRLGATTIIHYANALGLANQSITGYPLKTDTRQGLSLIAQGYNLANSSVGQGPVLVTPVQVTAMMNVIASGGIYYQPRLVAGLDDDTGHRVQQVEGPKPHRVMDQKTAMRLQALLREVTKTGVGQRADLPGWGSAGKTGSAQVTGEPGPINAWFAGYVPAKHPRYVITVLVRDGQSGGATAAPLFQAIAASLLELD